MPEKAIYLITGVMASGKSTVGGLLAAMLPKAVHLRGDVFRKMIASGREDMSPSPSEEALRQLRLRYRLAAEAAKTYYEGGFSVVLQDNYYGQDLFFLIGLLKDYPLRVVVLAPDLETVKAREQMRGKKGYGAFAPEALYRDFMEKTPRVGLWLNTSRQSPEETAAAILGYFQE